MGTDELTFEDFLHPERIADLLRDGWPDLSAASLSDRFHSLAQHPALSAQSTSRAVAAYVPGRIEIAGKHTDYAGGQSLTCAVQRAFCMLAVPTDAPGLEVQDHFRGTSAFFPYDGSNQSGASNWTLYPTTVVRRLVANFGMPKCGITIVFNSDIPRASGMSSSSALVVGLWLCMAALIPVDRTEAFAKNLRRPEDLAGFLGCVENGADYRGLVGDEGVGTQGGAQDHTAILYSRARELGYFGYRPLMRLDRVPFPDELSIVVASSGVHAHKASSAREDYNQAVHLAEYAVGVWNRGMERSADCLENVVAASDYSEEAFDRLLHELEPDARMRRRVFNRVRQFAEETKEIIPDAIESLKTGHYERFGGAIERSHRLADECLGNQVAETRFLVDSARRLGALAASAFGAGFGGSVYAIIGKTEADALLREWMAAYGKKFENRLRQACFFSDSSGPGAFVLGADPGRLLLEPPL